MERVHSIVSLVDVDNTLLDNDGVQQDLKDHLERAYGRDARDRYWRILEDLFLELGYRDYLGALQRFRAEHPREVELLSMSAYLIDYPFAGRLFPCALNVLRRLRDFGPTVILSDGDVVFQPHKVERAGLSDAVDGRVLIYIHKEEALAMTSSGVFQLNITCLSTTNRESWRRSSASGVAASRPFSRGRAAMPAIRKVSAPCRRPMS